MTKQRGKRSGAGAWAAIFLLVPKDSSGKDAYVEGRAAVEEISEREARHYEAEAIDGDPSKVHGRQRVVSFTATGVRLVSAD